MLPQQVLEAVVERLMDFEEKVRSRAVAALCEAATKDLQVLKCCRVIGQTSNSFCTCLFDESPNGLLTQ